MEMETLRPQQKSDAVDCLGLVHKMYKMFVLTLAMEGTAIAN